MLRLVELALFIAPFLGFAVWRFMIFEGGPSTRVVVAAACLLAVAAAVLIWLSRQDALPPDASYEPARLQSGKVIAGHAAPPGTTAPQ